MAYKAYGDMNPSKRSGKYETSLPPISIDRNLKSSLSDQVAEALRQAIRTGFYRPGDILPPYEVLGGHLGVSSRVARDAVRRLVEESMVMSRPRVGCQILPPRAKCCQGRVLAAASVENMTSRYHAALLLEIGRILSKAGYLFELAPLFAAKNGRVDLVPLEDKLRGPVNLTMGYHPLPPVSRRLFALDVPYVAVGSRSEMDCTTYVRRDGSAARAAFVKACVRRGVHSAYVVFYGANTAVADMLSEAGVSVEYVKIPVKFGFHAAEELERDAMNLFLERFGGAKSRRRLPDVICAIDDFIVRGALTALSLLGIRIPEDVRFAGSVNEGAIPAFTRSIACFKTDPLADARVVADVLLRHLKGRKVPHEIFYGMDFVAGETF